MMNILGCLDRPTSGSYMIDGQDVAKLNDDQLAEMRNLKLGFVFQSYNLLPKLTAVTMWNYLFGTLARNITSIVCRGAGIGWDRQKGLSSPQRDVGR